jgi:hypothetical protein
LIPTLMELKGIDPLVLRADELTRWCFTDNDPCWPIPKGRACRDSEFKVTVRLDVEAQAPEAWKRLRQHLADDPVLGSIDSWKIAMQRDLEARLCLLRTIARLIQSPADEGGLGLPIFDADNIGFDGCPEPAVSRQYAFKLLVQLMCQALQLKHGLYSRDTFGPENPNLSGNNSGVMLGNDRIIWSPDANQREWAIEYFLNKQEEWVSMPETQAAADAYRLAEEKTAEVKRHLERLGLDQVFPRGTTCDGCKGWSV